VGGGGTEQAKRAAFVGFGVPEIRFDPAVETSQPQFFTDDLSCSDVKDPDLSFSLMPSVSRARSIGNAGNARTLSFP
jgi:hypothetical protein